MIAKRLGNILLVCLSCWGFPVFSQFNVHFEEATNEVRDVKYIADPDSSQSVSNYFITEIAKSIPRRYDFTAYQCTFRRVLRVISTAPGIYEVNIDINEAKCNGDVMYKGFDISDVLFPNRISLKATLLNKYKKTVKEFDVVSMPLHWGYNKLVAWEFEDTIREPAFTFYAEHLRIWYDDEALQAFAEKQELIDKYYLSKAMIDQGMKKLETFNFSNVDMILVYDIMLKEVEKQVDELFSYDFPGQLNLSAGDPINFIDRFTAFSEGTNQVRARENLCLATLDKIYYDRGMDFLSKDDVSKAVLYFKRSFSYNPYYVPSHYQYAKILFFHDSVTYAADVVRRILTEMNPDPAFHDSATIFGKHIYDVLLQQGKDNLQLEKYNESLSLFEAAITFCTQSQGVDCTNEVYTGYAESKHGVYRSYLQVSEKAIQNGRFELAEVYIDEARQYQQANSKEIIGAAAADAVTAKLVKAMAVKADTLNGRKKFAQALEWCEKASAICAGNNEVKCGDELERAYRKAYNGIYNQMLVGVYARVTNGRLDLAEEELAAAREYQELHYLYITYTKPADTIDRRIQSDKYAHYIAQGVVMCGYATYRPALDLFTRARLLENTYTLEKDLRLDSLLLLSARPVVKSDMQRVKTMLKNGGHEAAGALVDSLSRVINDCRLQNDSLISLQLSRGLENVQQATCIFAVDSLARLEEQIAVFRNEMDFISVKLYYELSLVFLHSYPLCRIDSIEMLENILIISPLADYQAMIKMAGTYLRQKDTMAFFKQYLTAEEFFREGNLEAYRLRHVRLLDSVISGESMYIQKLAVHFFLSEHLIIEANDVLFQLWTRYGELYRFEQEQIMVACALAEMDYAIDPLSDTKMIIRAYTQGNAWYAPFKKAYMKRSRELRK